MCLDEELTSSLDSNEQTLATQDLTLSPIGTYMYIRACAYHFLYTRMLFLHTDFAEEPIKAIFPRTKPSHGNCFSSDNSQEAGDDLQADIEAEEKVREEMLQEQSTQDAQAELAKEDKNGSAGQQFTNCGTQTEREPVKVYREVCCECDIIVSSKEEKCNRDSSVQTSPLMTQLKAIPAGQETESRATQTQQVELKERTVQTREPSPPPLITVAVQTDLHNGSHASTSSVKLLAAAESSGQCLCGLKSNARAGAIIEGLRREVAKLKEDLGTAQSTLIWQSLMHKLK